MNSEFDSKLVNDFPNLYKDRDSDPLTSAMSFGFPGDGWYKLIYNLSEKLEKMILSLPKEDIPFYRASQVKQKWGQLRFYMTAQTPDMTMIICQAENDSLKICENCGDEGCLRDDPFIKVLCNNCLKDICDNSLSY